MPIFISSSRPGQVGLRFFAAFAVLFGTLPLLALPDSSLAHQQDGAAARPAKPAKSKKESPMKGESRELEGDRFITREEHPVKLTATYYFGNADKETVPVLLLHDTRGSRNDFKPLIDRLTNKGYAVLVADLRGHGFSTKRYEVTPPKIEMKTVTKPRKNSGGSTRKPLTYQEPTRVEGSRKLVDYEQENFKPEDYLLMAEADLPLLRAALEHVHAEGMVNLNRLVIVGIGTGAALAAYETMQDWKDKNSDRFTKTLVLIAPANLIPSADTSRFFEGNKWIRERVAVLFAVPEGNTPSQALVEKIRTLLLDKNAEEDKGGMESAFPILTYSTENTSGKSKGEMTHAEAFSRTKLGLTVFNFIDKRNKAFKDNEYRWTKLK